MQKQLNVLIVEDDKHVASLINDILSDKFEGNIRIDFAENGLMAKVKIQNDTYDLIVLDINMPIMDGAQFLDIIKEKKISPPTLVVTATPEIVQESVGDRIYKMEKPFDYKKLSSHVDKTLQAAQ